MPANINKFNYNIEETNDITPNIIEFIERRLGHIKLHEVKHKLILNNNKLIVKVDTDRHGYAVIGVGRHNEEHGLRSVKYTNYALAFPSTIAIVFKSKEEHEALIEKERKAFEDSQQYEDPREDKDNVS